MPSGGITPQQVLRAASLRVTAPRVAVLTELQLHPHADADALTQAVRDRIGSVSTQTIYDVLHALTRARIVRRFEPAGSPARYELSPPDNHHHVVCRACGRIDDVPCATGSAPCLEAAETHGYLIDEAEVVYWGLCPDCRRRTDEDPYPTVAPQPAAASPSHHQEETP